jgi:hypothetical protein
MSLNNRNASAGSAVAWDTAGTPAALRRWLAQRLARSLGWFCAPAALLYVTVVWLPPLAAWITVWGMGVLVYCLAASLFRVADYRRMSLVLRNYPWQQHDGLRLKQGKAAVFVLPDPDDPRKTASPKEPGLFFKRWDRIARQGLKEELWYAGDPRFAVVIARPGIKAMGYARQPTAFNPRTSPRSRGISAEARQRALAIGARVGPERGT